MKRLVDARRRLTYVWVSCIRAVKRGSLTRRLVRRMVRLVGLEVVKSSSKPDVIRAFAALLAERDITLVLDVGANVGEFGARLRQLGYEGRILSFEPRAAAYERLARRAAMDQAWATRKVALGDEAGEMTLHVSSNEVSSSLLRIERGHVDAAPTSAYVSAERVCLVRLDIVVVCDGTDRLALKLDVQGYEEVVLRGASRLLPGIEIIQVELSLAPLYRGQPDWRTMVDALTAMGFELHAIEPVFRDPVTGATLQVDALFRRATSATTASER